MMFVACGENRLPDPVILEVHLGVVLTPGTLFRDRNAAANSAVISDNPSITRFEVAMQSHQFALAPADRPFFQAEVLIPFKVSPSFIFFPQSVLTLFSVQTNPI